MRKTTIIMGITMIVLCGALFTIVLSYQNSIDDYLTLEKDLVEATQSYVKIEYKNEITDTLEVTTSDLVKKGYIEEDILTVNEDKCKGSVKVIKSFDSLEYEADIKCKDYSTYK